jgi:hypothetical protein
MARSRLNDPIEPMDLANMRANGVRSLDVQCDNCRHRVIVNRIVEAGAGHHDHPIASRPASVILSQVTTIERRATIVAASAAVGGL